MFLAHKGNGVDNDDDDDDDKNRLRSIRDVFVGRKDVYGWVGGGLMRKKDRGGVEEEKKNKK